MEVHHDGEAVAVEERYHAEEDLVLLGAGVPHPGAHLQGVGDEVAVAEHGALGGAGRASGVEEEGGIVGAYTGALVLRRMGADKVGEAVDVVAFHAHLAAVARLFDREGRTHQRR